MESLNYFDNDELKTTDSYKVEIETGILRNSRNRKVNPSLTNDIFLVSIKKKKILSRLIYEHYMKEQIPSNLTIQYLDGNYKNNKLSNLTLIKRTYTPENRCMIKRSVKAINTDDINDFEVYKSIYSCAKHLNINKGLLNNILNGRKYYKNNIQKDKSYTFEFTTDDITYNK